MTQITFTIPPSIPNGDYLIRVEDIALHVAQSPGGAQFYISCAQVTVQGGSGSGKPGPLVAIPGVYTGNEPGILISTFILILQTRGPVCLITHFPPRHQLPDSG